MGSETLYVFKSFGKYYKTDFDWVKYAEQAKQFTEEEAVEFAKANPTYIKINTDSLMDGSYEGP